MRRPGWFLASFAGLAVCLFAFVSCGGEGNGDSNLPVRRARMRQIKLSTDRMIASLKNESLEGVSGDAGKIQKALKEVVDLYPPAHKEKYVTYNREAQTVALAIAAEADAKRVKGANTKFRELVPYCGKCHEDCAFMLAPAFPEYEE